MWFTAFTEIGHISTVCPTFFLYFIYFTFSPPSFTLLTALCLQFFRFNFINLFLYRIITGKGSNRATHPKGQCRKYVITVQFSPFSAVFLVLFGGTVFVARRAVFKNLNS
jgi:hypothetical protein